MVANLLYSVMSLLSIGAVANAGLSGGEEDIYTYEPHSPYRRPNRYENSDAGCSYPGDIENGSHSGSKYGRFVYGDSVKYTCKEGYEMAGSASRTCFGIRGWKPEPPVCKLFNPCDYSICGTNAVCENHGHSKVVCSCKDGYTGNPRVFCTYISNSCAYAPCHQHATCEETEYGGHRCTCKPGFVGDGLSCKIPRCRTPLQPIHGWYTPNVVYIPDGGSIIYTCQQGYERHGPERHECKRPFSELGRSYCVDIDECEHNLCDDKATCTNTEGSYQCECNRGYIGNGKQCKEIVHCNPPRLPYGYQGNYEEKRSTYSVGEYVAFSCRYGYTVLGKDTAICQANGLWSTSVPRCVRRRASTSCKGRCGQTLGTGRSVGSCACDGYCTYRRTCCRDFDAYCSEYDQ